VFKTAGNIFCVCELFFQDNGTGYVTHFMVYCLSLANDVEIDTVIPARTPRPILTIPGNFSRTA
jgi:hypothetical protein